MVPHPLSIPRTNPRAIPLVHAAAREPVSVPATTQRPMMMRVPWSLRRTGSAQTVLSQSKGLTSVWLPPSAPAIRAAVGARRCARFRRP